MLEPISFPQRAVPPTPPSQKRDLKTIDLRSGEINAIIRSTGLVEQQWFPYHARAIRKLGPTRYLELADTAKTGSNPKSLFSWMLKQELV